MTVLYATAAEVLAWLDGDPPAGDLDRLIARASELVDANVRAEYSVDDDDLPTDTTVAAALRDAVCAQIEQWVEVDESNSIDGLAGTQIAVDGYSGPRAPDLAPRARHLLKVNGLLGPHPVAISHTPAWGLW